MRAALRHSAAARIYHRCARTVVYVLGVQRFAKKLQITNRFPVHAERYNNIYSDFMTGIVYIGFFFGGFFFLKKMIIMTNGRFIPPTR